MRQPQAEEIVWIPYPENKPKPSDSMHLVTHKEIGVTDMWWMDTKWDWDDENIIAYAMPKGYEEGMNKDLNDLMATDVMGWHLDNHTRSYWLDEREEDTGFDWVAWHPAGTDDKSMGQAMRCADEMKLDINISKSGRKWWPDIEDMYFGPVVPLVELPKAICECIAEAIKDD